MGKVHRFRRLRHGPPRELPTPDFLRQVKARERRRRWLGVAVLAAVIAAAVLLFGLWR